MTSFKVQLQAKLAEALTKEELDLLPSSFQRLGHIVILRLKRELLPNKHLICENALALVPGAKTCGIYTGKIDTEYREPTLEYVAGEDFLEVDHKEHGCVFRFDASKLMWSMGNMNERKRMYEVVKKGEVVVDFFAGLGYWSIPISKHAQPEHVYSIEANPNALEALRVNKKLNKIPDSKMTILPGRCEEVAPTLGKIADRVIMGYFPAPSFALPAAFHVLKERGGVIHYEGETLEGKWESLVQEVREHAIQFGKQIELLHVQPVKSTGPRKWHYVIDVKVTNINQVDAVVSKNGKK